MSNLQLIRGADIEVIEYRGCAKITINDQFEHVFNEKSRVSQALKSMSTDELQERLSGGYYFIQDDMLVDFRDGQYVGFIHDDDSIKSLGDVVGDEYMSSRRRVAGGSAVLGRRYSDHEIELAELGEGGQFKSMLNFTWSPFHKNINTLFQIERLICTNGMTGLSSFFNASIPILNKWEEHLEIANRQIQKRVNEKMTTRLSEMTNERASVAELLTISQHAATRLQSDVQTVSQHERLVNILKVSDPLLHLNTVYRNGVFENNHVASQMPGHLTVFDAWNLATELNTHTGEDKTSSSNALHKLSNDLLLARQNSSADYRKDNSPILSHFSDPDRAFFGS